MKTVNENEVQILNEEAAYRGVLHKLSKFYILDSVIRINDGRYCIGKLLNEGNIFNVLITYKHDVFKSFGAMFAKYGAEGVGDTINCDDLEKAQWHNVSKIFIVFPTGRVYSIFMEDFIKKSIIWENKEGKSVRSISIKEYLLEFKL